MNISNDEKFDLKKLISQTVCDDNTDQIVKLKHSNLIANDVNILNELKKQGNLDIEVCKEKCFFLYKNYTDIFNKIVKDEIDIKILSQFLLVLKMIEDGKVDQHEGSVIVGKILKELYVDSALKMSDNLDKKYAAEVPDKNEGVKMSWKEYRNAKK